MKEMNYKIETYRECSYSNSDTLDITIHNEYVQIGWNKISLKDLKQMIAIMSAVRFEED